MYGPSFDLKGLGNGSLPVGLGPTRLASASNAAPTVAADGYKPAANRKPACDATNARLQARVTAATQRATAHFHDQHTKCYRTAALAASLLGGDLSSAPMSLSARGQSIAHLAESEKAGKLKPGMVIYCDRRPGTDPMSINLANKPHWFTYVGKDAKGVMRFADQYGANFSLDDMQRMYGRTRRIDALYDPLHAQRTRNG